MSAALVPAIEGSDASNRLPEVSRLAAHLATNVIQAQIGGQPVPDGHIRSLLDAALLLREYGVALPSLLGQIMTGVAEPDVAPRIGDPGAGEPKVEEPRVEVPSAEETGVEETSVEETGAGETRRSASGPRPDDDDDAGRLAWLLRPFRDAAG